MKKDVIYVITPIAPTERQLSFDDIFNGVSEREMTTRGKIGDTRCRTVEALSPRNKCWNSLRRYISILEEFIERHADLYAVENRHDLYHSFKIPKRNGKLRPIDAPLDPLMDALHELKSIFEQHFYARYLYHTSSFAYVGNRCPKQVAERHTANHSNWYGKLDDTNFFNNHSFEYVMKMLSMVFPFAMIVMDPKGKAALEKVIDLCFLDGGLPQGTPMSPMLTNICCIPIDYELSRFAQNFTINGKHYPLVYTRYADDKQFSCVHDFNVHVIEDEVERVYAEFDSPLRLNKEKTKYGSIAGSNWMLGVMINKDNQITVGWQRKAALKNLIYRFMLHPEQFELQDVQHLLGELDYCRSIEFERIGIILKQYSDKFGKDVREAIISRIKKGA